MANKIKAVIFDMDGVLIDAKDWHYEALNKILQLFGMPISHQDHLTKFDGLPTKDKLEMLSNEKGLSRELHTFINEMKQQYTMEMVYNFCNPMFNHEFALSQLKRDGYYLAVASNSIRNTIQVMLSKANLIQHLEFFLSNQDVVKGKPNPEIYNKAISRLGFRPDECVIVEDNENGIRAAKASGAHVLEVDTVHDVNYDNISRFIAHIEETAK